MKPSVDKYNRLDNSEMGWQQFKSQLNFCDHDTCSLSVIAANHCPLLSFCTSSAMWSSLWLSTLCCCWEVTSQHLSTQSWWCHLSLSNPPTALLVPQTLSFSQFPATPLGPWVLSERLFFTEPHRCQPMVAWEADCTWCCGANVRHPQLHTSWRESTFREHECFYF